jgi:uncharacterized glyoxalase superfamily protein PhnB
MDQPSNQFVRTAPYFPVGDVVKSSSYYQTVLGFKQEYAGGSPPIFAIVSRDGQPIMLRIVDNPAAIVPNERQGGTWDAFFWVTDVEALHSELAAKGADVAYAPVVQPYGMKEFAIRDADGHVLGFGQQWQGDS